MVCQSAEKLFFFFFNTKTKKRHNTKIKPCLELVDDAYRGVIDVSQCDVFKIKPGLFQS